MEEPLKATAAPAAPAPDAGDGTDTGTTPGEPPDRRGALAALVGAAAVLVVVVALVALEVRSTGRPPPAGARPPAGVPGATVPAANAVERADREAQGELVRAITVLKGRYAAGHGYGLVTLPWLAQHSPALTWVGAATSVRPGDQVSLALTPQSALAATRSGDGACWYVLDAEPGAGALATYGLPGPAVYFDMRPGGACEGSDPPLNGWGQTFPRS